MMLNSLIRAVFFDVLEAESPKLRWAKPLRLISVGYGDIVLVTLAGKIIGAVIMLLGIGMLVLPAGMLASRFFSRSVAPQRNACPDAPRPASLCFDCLFSS